MKRRYMQSKSNHSLEASPWRNSDTSYLPETEAVSIIAFINVCQLSSSIVKRTRAAPTITARRQPGPQLGRRWPERVCRTPWPRVSRNAVDCLPVWLLVGQVPGSSNKTKAVFGLRHGFLTPCGAPTSDLFGFGFPRCQSGLLFTTAKMSNAPCSLQTLM